MVVRDHIGCAVQLDCGRGEGGVLGARQHVPQWMDGSGDGHGDGGDGGGNGGGDGGGDGGEDGGDGDDYIFIYLIGCWESRGPGAQNLIPIGWMVDWLNGGHDDGNGVFDGVTSSLIGRLLH